MLRSLVLILLLVNAAFFAWTQGWLNEVVGIRPDGQREPQRLTQQKAASQLIVVKPEPAEAPGSAPAASPASEPASADVASASEAEATRCLEAGPFPATQRPQLEALLRPVLPTAARQIDTVTVQGLWMVYMGPYADNDALGRKQDELRRIRGIAFEPVRSPASLAPGLSLGRYTTQAEAEAALERIRLRGIRTARTVTLRPASELLVVRVPRASGADQQALAALTLPQNRGFAACR